MAVRREHWIKDVINLSALDDHGKTLEKRYPLYLKSRKSKSGTEAVIRVT